MLNTCYLLKMCIILSSINISAILCLVAGKVKNIPVRYIIMDISKIGLSPLGMITTL